MPSRLLLTLVSALVLVVLLVRSAPSHLVSRFVDADKLVAQGFSGTVWRGQADQVYVATEAGFLRLGQLQWRLHPMSLLTLRPRLDVSSQWGGQRFNGELTLHSDREIEFGSYEARLPVALINQFLPLAVEGDATISGESLSLVDGLPQRAEGRAVWQNALWNSPAGPRRLGDYVLEFTSPVAERIDGKLFSLAGPVNAEGELELKLNQRSYRVDIVLSSEQPFEVQLQQSLALMAEPVENGYRFALTGEF